MLIFASMLQLQNRYLIRSSGRQKKLARSNITPRQAWVTDGVPNLKGQYAILEVAIRSVEVSLDQLYHDADRDNKFIYFQEVPPVKRPPSLPPEASVMSSVNYAEPERSQPPLEFIYTPPPSIFASWFSRGGPDDAGGSNGEVNAKSKVEVQLAESPIESAARTATTAPTMEPSAPPAPQSDSSHSHLSILYENQKVSHQENGGSAPQGGHSLV